MSQKKHKGNHAGRAERRAAAHKERASTPATIYKPQRVYLRNGLHIFLTIFCILATLAVIVVFQLLDWWDNLVGSVLVVAVGAFGCMCIYDLGLLFSACVAFGEGMVSAGKNAEGTRMVFHAASVLRLEVRDAAGNVLPEGKGVYKNAELAFVMESGRVNLKRVSRLTDKQLAALREALETERRAG